MCLCGMCMRRVPEVRCLCQFILMLVRYLTLPCLALPTYLTYLPYLPSIHPFIHSIISDAIFDTKKKKTIPLPPIENTYDRREKKRKSGLFEGDFFAPCSFFPTRRYLLCQKVSTLPTLGTYLAVLVLVLLLLLLEFFFLVYKVSLK